MFYHLADLLSINFDIPGLGMFEYISFRSALAIIVSLLIAIVFGRRIIDALARRQIGEEVRQLGLQGQIEKRGTPTMGGIIILLSVLIPSLMFCDLSNIYVQLIIGSTIWLGLIGFADDYIKVFRRKKDGLKGKFKIIGQVGLGLIVGTTMWLNSDITVVPGHDLRMAQPTQELVQGEPTNIVEHHSKKLSVTTIPFLKHNELNYNCFISETNENRDIWGWVLYVAMAIVVITAVSNGANLTDGLDGLAAGTSAIVAAALAVLAYVSGNLIYAEYLNIMYIPHIGELFVFSAALVGALIGFLWYNSYPAQVFMGDTGSLAIGGIIAVLALLVRKELLVPVLCGIFLIESVSVMMQVGWFKFTRKKYGEGRRIFLMAPLHHHYQKKGFFEVKIVTRIWIVQLLLAAVALITLKIR